MFRRRMGPTSEWGERSVGVEAECWEEDVGVDDCGDCCDCCGEGGILD